MRKSIVISLFITLSLAVFPQLVTAQSIDLLYQQGISAQNEGKHSDAESVWRQVLELTPKDATAYFYLGKALYSQKKLEEAIAAYQKAIQLNPNDVRAHNNLGVILTENKKLDEAIAVYRKAIQIDPQFALAYKNLGLLLYDQKKIDEAIAVFREATPLNPKNTGDPSNVGNSLTDRKKLDAVAYKNLGNALYDQEKLDAAIAAYNKAIQLNPNDALAYNNLGIALYDQKKLDAAISAYRTALTLPDTPGPPARDHTLARNGLGLVFQEQGKLKEAIAEYEQAVALEPNYVYARNNLKEAQRLLTKESNTQVETADDREWLPKNEPSLPILRPVVFVTAEFKTGERQGNENGTGIVIKREGDRALIITNRHVIFDKDSGQQGKNIKVEFYSQPPSGKVRMRRSAKLLTMTEPNDPIDLAVLEITDNLPEDIQPLSTSVDPIHRGMPIRAIGHPYDDFPWALQTGEITSYNSAKILISTIQIKQGYSGGPVINSKNNQLLGMIVERDSSGQTFAHPISVIKEKLRKMGLQAL